MGTGQYCQDMMLRDKGVYRGGRNCYRVESSGHERNYSGFNFFFFFTIPLWSRGGTEDLELGEINVLRIDHQFLDERESDFSLFEILSM